MISYPNYKVNLGLHVLSRRPDGYHNIESIFLPVADQTDVLEINVVDTHGEPTATLTSNDATLANDNNLVLRAYRAVRQQFPTQVGSVAMHLEKRLPYGAGIGSGSADAAFAIRMLNDLFGLGMADYGMAQLAAQVGADCPFFVYNQPSYVTGIGDIMIPVPFSLERLGLCVRLTKPDGVDISTKEAYASITPRNLRPTLYTPNLASSLQQPVEQWQQLFVNDFEEGVIDKYPQVGELKQRMIDDGALYASMTGSGSGVFGIFRIENK